MYMNDGNKTKINLRNKSVFITGVAGFIGSSLAKRLLSTVEGVKVVGLDNMNHYYDVRLKEARLNELEQFDNFSFVKGNLADKAVIESIFEQYKPEIVVNLGAQAGVRYSITNPDAYVEANLIGFYNILEACRHSYDEGHTPVEHLVYASSSSVYGSNKKVPYSTDDKVDNPVSLYAATKKSNELMAHAYSRKTKLGRVEWNPGTLAGVLANERHCGDVLARKTFTPNFLTHKSKKNNNDRTQYRQKNHHEAIVSREVFNAANHLRASRNYSKKNRPLPVLSVVEDGILRGYVPFDKDWTGFSAEEYREASESVMKEPDVTVTADVKKRLDLTGYEIVRVQYFSTMQNPAMTISNGRLRFNTACLKKFENVEYVELLLNSVERCIAIRPCDKNNPNAIRWGRLKEGRWCASTLGCRGLAKTLFDIMEWDEDLRYRFRGQFLEQGDNKMMLFAFDEPEMIKVEEIVLPPKENTEEDEGETVKKKIYIFPPEWAGTFGQPITSIAQVGILRQEHYAGNWDVFRPATEIEEMNIFTAESLNELLREAEKIMEGWTDYR